MPTDAPKNISWRFQTPDVVEIVYDPPPEHARNGQVGFILTEDFDRSISSISISGDEVWDSVLEGSQS